MNGANPDEGSGEPATGADRGGGAGTIIIVTGVLCLRT